MDLDWQQVITLGIAGLGAVLGVMNTWQARRRDRLRLRVRPIHFSTTAGEQGHGIEVINLSTFAVTVEEIGFTMASGRADKGQRLAIVRPILSDGGPWPRRLEARGSVTAYFDLGTEAAQAGRAYARTACGEIAYGPRLAI